MKTRIITGVVAGAIMIPFLIFSDTWAFPLLIAMLSCIGIIEMLRCLGVDDWEIKLPCCLTGVLLPLCARYYRDEKGFLNFSYKIFITLLLLLFVLAVFSKGKKDVEKTGMVFATVYFISMSFSSIVLLRDYEYGNIIYLLVLLCPWATDIFAYFTGYFFGKRKLIPDVSPKKTVEGAIGGTVCCVITFVIIGRILDSTLEVEPNYIGIIVTGIVIAVVSQCGDLIFSLIKRKYGIKDYGKVLPGHGGVLDRFDSVIAVAPVVLMLFDLSNVFRLFS